MINHNESDIVVQSHSSCLDGMWVDLVVTGSIAACESVRFVRALRALGARVRVCLSPQADLFVTQTSLEWASGEMVLTHLTGQTTHLSSADICVVAPCSASFLSKMASGICDHLAATLVQSYLGSLAAVMVLPCMHNTLFDSPMIQKSLRDLKQAGVIPLASRQQDHKQKFPAVDRLAREVSYYAHRSQRNRDYRVVINMGSTRGYLDPVRYLTGRSSGELATTVVHELYGYGFDVHVVCGDSRVIPSSYSSLILTHTVHEMTEAMIALLAEPAHVLLTAAVSDYIPHTTLPTKISSGQDSQALRLIPTEKIRSRLAVDPSYEKICFKQSVDPLSEDQKKSVYQEFHHQDGVTMVIFNALQDMDTHQQRYKAQVFQCDKITEVNSKRALGHYLAGYLIRCSEG